MRGIYGQWPSNLEPSRARTIDDVWPRSSSSPQGVQTLSCSSPTYRYARVRTRARTAEEVSLHQLAHIPSHHTRQNLGREPRRINTGIHLSPKGLAPGIIVLCDKQLHLGGFLKGLRDMNQWNCSAMDFICDPWGYYGWNVHLL
jgi:hypothetical protein